MTTIAFDNSSLHDAGSRLRYTDKRVITAGTFDSLSSLNPPNPF